MQKYKNGIVMTSACLTLVCWAGISTRRRVRCGLCMLWTRSSAAINQLTVPRSMDLCWFPLS